MLYTLHLPQIGGNFRGRLLRLPLMKTRASFHEFVAQKELYPTIDGCLMDSKIWV
jgi:hypothetical protein